MKNWVIAYANLGSRDFRYPRGDFIVTLIVTMAFSFIAMLEPHLGFLLGVLTAMLIGKYLMRSRFHKGCAVAYKDAISRLEESEDLIQTEIERRIKQAIQKEREKQLRRSEF